MTYYTRLTETVKGLHENPSDNCLIWFGTISGRYGQLQYGQYPDGRRRRYVVHRLAWEVYHEQEFPEGLVAHHKCMNTACYNPLHILPVTPYENLAMPDGIVGISKSRTHCPNGHEYNEQNTRIYRGSRHCRECDRIRNIPRNELAKAKRRSRAQLAI